MPIAEAHGAFGVEILDLRDWPLPFFQETIATVGDFAAPTYSDPLVKLWNSKIKEADAYIFVTPEYNHSVPAVLKECHRYSVLFIQLPSEACCLCWIQSRIHAAGARAIEHLTQIMVETEAVPVRTPTLVPFVTAAFDQQGEPTNPAQAVTLNVMLDDLAWLGKALATARAEGQLPPAAFRIRAASERK